MDELPVTPPATVIFKLIVLDSGVGRHRSCPHPETEDIQPWPGCTEHNGLASAGTRAASQVQVATASPLVVWG